MSEASVPTLLGQIIGGGTIAVAAIKILEVWITKMNLSLGTDKASAELREEMRADMRGLRELVAKLQLDLVRALEAEGAAKAEAHALRAEVALLRGEIAGLRGELSAAKGLLEIARKHFGSPLVLPKAEDAE